MKLELTRSELEGVLLEWASQKWPGLFNKVEIDGTQRPSVDSAVFSKVGRSAEPWKKVE